MVKTNFKLHDYGRGILLVTNPFPEELAHGFLRPSESYGNPKWKNRGAFTHEQFLRAFDKLIRADICDNFAYEYPSFGFPGEKLRLFYEGVFNPTPNLEGQVLSLLKRPTNSGRRRTYIMGVKEGDTDSLNHEFSVAFSYLDPDGYGKETLKIIKAIPADLKAKMREWYINDASFLRRAIPSQIVAELVDDDSYLFDETGINRENAAIQAVQKPVRKLFRAQLKTLHLSS